MNPTQENRTNAALQNQLNTQLANWSVLGVKLHAYHWFVKGPQFFTLHKKFEELYGAAAGYTDELAERLLAIGGTPAASMSQYLQLASVKEYSGPMTAEEMTADLASDFRTIAAQLSAGIVEAGQEGDEPSGDLLTGMKAEVEKQAWMLESFSGR
ncbi:DNA starvation/stationary phase protection protein [Paenibacillus sp. F411]|nr:MULTISPECIES: DNA starvation/stationary phase protection protein [Paenibacillus]MBO2944014.1 DNA starvation/stationary phase protection protein [Paenibacillus sp. F411]